MYIEAMNHSDDGTLIAYRFPDEELNGGHSHLYRLKPRNSAASVPVTVIIGMPAILYFAIAEFWYRLFFLHGRIAAAMQVPKNVTAITSVASMIHVFICDVYA